MVDQPDVFTALAHPVRRKILAMARDEAMAAGEIADAFDLARPTLSGHFNVLKAAGLITVERRGTKLLYAANLSVLEDALSGLMDMLRLGEAANETLKEIKDA
ncbi:MAG: metalloregulator ArsR/SmtB family transcription factor [Parvularculaceae bacterium]